MVPLPSHKVSRVSWYSGSCLLFSAFAYGAFTLFGRLSQNRSAGFHLRSAVHTRRCSHPRLGSFPFARRYSENRCFFLFLPVLRCFSSRGSPCMAMDSPCSDCGLHSRVSPFRHPWVSGYLLLTTAFRSLSRLSSALSAKASSLCSSSLDLSFFESCLLEIVSLFLSF